MFQKNCYVLSLLIFFSPAVFAGNLDSPAGPDDLDSAMYSLQAVCERLDSGETGSKQAFTEPDSGPADSTRCTLNEVMDKAPAVDNTNGTTPADVLEGKTFWGLNSDYWGSQTGTLPTQTPSNTTVDQPAGHYNTFDLSTVDTDLVANNIKSGVTIFGIEGTYPAAAVAKTGQTICYDNSESTISCSGTGQDGDKKVGVAWPNPRFTDNGDGTVTDKLTGLIWLKNANCNNGKMNWTDALNFANALYDGSTSYGGGDCGLSDSSIATHWRLPNLKELYSLIDLSRKNPALPTGHLFSGVQLDYYWSSTTSANNTSKAWDINLNSGRVDDYDKVNSVYVWPVRGAQ